jgi:uncharacterized membrane protein YgcG
MMRHPKGCPSDHYFNFMKVFCSSIRYLTCVTLVTAVIPPVACIARHPHHLTSYDLTIISSSSSSGSGGGGSGGSSSSVRAAGSRTLAAAARAL